MNEKPSEERIDEAIDELVKAGTPPQSGDSELDELARLASRLGGLPDPDFKERLRSQLGLEPEGGLATFGRAVLAPPRSFALGGLAVVLFAASVALVNPGDVRGDVGDAFQGGSDCPEGYGEVCEQAVQRERELNRLAALPPDWDDLRARPLQVPGLKANGACPLTPERELVAGQPDTGLGTGPVYPAMANVIGLSPEDAFVLLVSDPDYRRPVLLRGTSITSGESITFLDGQDNLVDALQLPAESVEASFDGVPAGWRAWPTTMQIESPGCYALQIDGTGFTEVVVFEVTACGLKLCTIEQDKDAADTRDAVSPSFEGRIGSFLVVPSAAEIGSYCPLGDGSATAVGGNAPASRAEIEASELYFSTEGRGTTGVKCVASDVVNMVQGQTVVTGFPSTIGYVQRFYFDLDALPVLLQVPESRLVIRELAGREALVVLRNQDLIPECQVYVVERPASDEAPGIALSVAGAFSCTAAKNLATEFLDAHGGLP